MMISNVMLAECYYTFQEVKAKGKTGKRFQGADKWIPRLAWLMKTFPDRVFTVCYEDRYLGLLECRVDHFIDKLDVPFHRIMLFKEHGQVCWDRKNKFCTI